VHGAAGTLHVGALLRDGPHCRGPIVAGDIMGRRWVARRAAVVDVRGLVPWGCARICCRALVALDLVVAVVKAAVRWRRADGGRCACRLQSRGDGGHGGRRCCCFGYGRLGGGRARAGLGKGRGDGGVYPVEVSGGVSAVALGGGGRRSRRGATAVAAGGAAGAAVVRAAAGRWATKAWWVFRGMEGLGLSESLRGPPTVVQQRLQSH